MTDQFYYNCLVPNAIPLHTGNLDDDLPPPPPPRPRRFDTQSLGYKTPQNSGDSRGNYINQGPEVPPRRASVPIHQRNRSAPVELWESSMSFSPAGYHSPNISSFSDSGYPTEEPVTPLRVPARFQEEHGTTHAHRVPAKSQNNHSVEPAQKSLIWQHSTEQYVYEHNTSSETYRHSSPLISPRRPTPEKSPLYENRSYRFESSETLSHYHNSSPVLASADAFPVFTENSASFSHTPEVSPSYKKSSSNPGSAEPSPGLPQRYPRRHTLDDIPSNEYPQTSPRKQEFHQSQIPRQSSAESETVPGYQNNAPSGAPSLRPSYSFKDNTTRTQSAYIGASTQPVPLSAIPQELQQLQSASAQIQRRSMPNPSRAIVEEDQVAENVSRLELGHSNITETISRSIESLDDVDSVQEVRYDDVELGKLDVDEPETWSETVDKKVLKKLNPKDIKRQDTIWELIQTERHYCKRLKTLQIFFRDGMLKDLQMDPRWVNRLFPHLDDLTHVHMNFLRELQDLQNRRPDKFIEDIGHTLKEQFSGESSNQMKASYGAFCSGHLEAVQLYKNLMEKKNFQMFIKSRMNHPLCKKREIPDFILLITQRPTKYPTLIEAVIKSTKDKKDRENLLSALELSKEVLQNVNAQVEAAERAMRLKDICNRLDSRSFAAYKGNKKFKKSDILSGGRRLLYEGMIGWRNARGKSVEVLAVVLTDVLFFLQENNQKYSFFSQDNKFGVVSLFNLLVREKRDTRDTIGMYLISQDKKNPEMYEIVFNTMTEMQRWAKILRAAVENCPEEEEEVPTEAEVERKRIEERAAKAQAIIEKLHEKDEEIRRCCNAKNKLMVELLSVYNDTDDSQSNSRPSSRDFDETQEMAPVVNAGTLQAALEEVSTRLNSLLQEKNSSLSRSVSSVGEHSSNTFPSIPVPKRAETFAGFDNNYDRAKVRSNGDAPDYASDTLEVAAEHDISDPDLASPYTELSPGQLKNLDEESGRGSSYSNLSTVSKLSPMSNPSQDPANIAHLLRTLDTIVYLTANQGTAVESLRAQLAEANERINKLSADVHEKKSGYRHNQLEELRNLQGVIQKEKEDWELKKTREQRDMEQERAQIDEMKRHLEKQEADIKQQKEELNKKREVLQRQMDLLRRSGQLPKDTSLSDLEAADQTDISVQSTSDFVPGHRRSASAESFNANGSETKKSSATKENNFRPENKSVTKLQSFSFGSKQKLPDHLLSATNEQKIGSKNVQQLPSKLLAGGTVLTSPQQGAYSGSQKTSPGGTSLGHGNQSSPTIALEHVHADLSHSSSTGQIGQVQGPLGSSMMVPKGNRQSNRPKPSPVSGGLSGVLKLAEKGDKKSKSSNSSSQSGDKGAQGAQSPPQEDKTSQQQRQKSGTSAEKNPQIIHKSQKSDSDVIYF